MAILLLVKTLFFPGKKKRILALLVLCHFIGLVHVVFVAESLPGFTNIHRVCRSAIGP